MDLPLFIAINILAASAIAACLAVVHRPAGFGGWALANGLVVVVGALALIFAETWVLWVTLAAFIPLVALPAALSHLALRASQAGKRERARLFAGAADVLLPSGHATFNIVLAEAMAAGSRAAVLDALSKLEAAARPSQRALIGAFAAAEVDDWASALAWTNRPDASPIELAPTKIRALGELGRFDDMVDVYEVMKTRLLGPHLHISQMFVFAFTGRVARVVELLAGRLVALDPEAKSYWSAIARLHAEPSDPIARQALASIASTSRREKSRSAAARHLAEARPHPVSPRTLARIDQAQARMERDAKRRSRPLIRLYATLAILAVNVAMFGWSEWRGGSENLRTLVDLGALWPPFVVERGEWWRLLSAAFLHFGPLHLTANMLMLLVLGRAVESTYGTTRMAVAYLWCALASNAAVCALMQFDWAEPGVLIGASGAIFGLFGIEVAASFAAWIRSRDRWDRTRLLSLGLVLGMQAVVDTIIPNFSFLAHASGVVAGLVAGAALVGLEVVRPSARVRMA